MLKPKLLTSLLVVTAFMMPVSLCWALGFDLGHSKEQLKLEYEVSVTDHGTGRVKVILSIADQGRLTPLTSVSLMIPDEDTKPTGGHFVDLSVSLATREEGGRQVARVHLLKEWAERAVIQLRTGHLDGKQSPLTWYYHTIPIVDYMKSGDQEAE